MTAQEFKWAAIPSKVGTWGFLSFFPYTPRPSQAPANLFLQRNAKELGNATKNVKLSPVPWKFCYKADVWAKVPVSRAAQAAGRQAGLSNPNQDSFLPLGDTDSFKGKKGPAYQVLATRSGRSAVHTMALVTAHLHFVGGAHRAGHRRSIQPLQEHRKVVRHQELLTKAKDHSAPCIQIGFIAAWTSYFINAP